MSARRPHVEGHQAVAYRCYKYVVTYCVLRIRTYYLRRTTLLLCYCTVCTLYCLLLTALVEGSFDIIQFGQGNTKENGRDMLGRKDTLPPGQIF